MTVPGLVQVVGIFMLAEVLMPLREVKLLNVFDRSLLSTFLVVSGTVFFNISGLCYTHISKLNLSKAGLVITC